MTELAHRAVASGGVLLVGSVPLRGTEEVFDVVSEQLGDRLRHLPDGETGPRADWIVWQYPVLSSRPEFEVCPPGPGQHRALPRLRIRDGDSIDTLRFGDLGYAQAALASFELFARRKRDGTIPAHCRFQVSLPTPLAPIAAFVAPEDQARVEPLYEARMRDELATIFEQLPHDQLAVQWDTNFEFAMLDGVMPAWFDDPRSSIVERLVRLGRSIPAGVQLGYHFCHGHEHHHRDRPYNGHTLVEMANALSLSLGRSLDWVHVPVQGDRVDLAFFETLAQLKLRPETSLYLGLLHPSDGMPGAEARIAAAQRFVKNFGIATDCGWTRHHPQDVGLLTELHRELSTPVEAATAARSTFSWPQGFDRVPDEDWTREPVDTFGSSYDSVAAHTWYRNLDPTVDELAHVLSDGDVLVDYSGGTGILLDRLKLRMFQAQVGAVIVDSSPKFLRVAVDKFAHDPRVAVRLLRYRKDDRRLDRLDEVLGPLADRGVDVIASTNAVHLYPDLGDTVAAWVRALRPGGRVLVNSGNIRNPRARSNEWILDETVWVVGDLAEGLVRTDPAYAAYRADVDNSERMGAHAAYRDKVFHHPRPLEFYVETFELAGLKIESVREASIEARVDQWYELLVTYSDAVLGWVGGTEKIDGTVPTEQALADRHDLIRHAMDVLFHGRPTFQACWTYLTCRNG